MPGAAASAVGFAQPGPEPGGDDGAGRQNLLLLIQLRWIAVGGSWSPWRA